MATITENDDDKNGDDTRDDTRMRIHEKSRIERSRISDFARERKQRGRKRYGRGRERKGKKKEEQHRSRWSKIWHM